MQDLETFYFSPPIGIEQLYEILKQVARETQTTQLQLRPNIVYNFSSFEKETDRISPNNADGGFSMSTNRLYRGTSIHFSLESDLESRVPMFKSILLSCNNYEPAADGAAAYANSLIQVIKREFEKVSHKPQKEGIKG